MITETPERHLITNRAGWLEMRRNDVTASEVAALFDLHPFRTRLQVYLSKTRLDGDEGDNPAMRRGRIMEPGVAAAFKEEHPEYGDLRKATDYWRLPALRLGCTPDYFIGDPERPGFGVMDCKTMSPEQWVAYNGAPPLAYTLQVSAQMMVTGAAWGCLAVMVMNRALDLYTFHVPRNAKAEAKLRAGVVAFWGAVDRGETPPPTMPADRETLVKLFPRDDGRTIDLTGDNELPALLAERVSLRAAEKRLKEINDSIRVKIGSAQRAVLPGWVITYASHHRKEYTVPAQDVRQLRITAEKDSLDDSVK
jgi:predicted phage-related endonuclease